MRVHFIAIGGSAMHNLALALHKTGYQVTGSDDEIFEPSRTRLADKGLLPKTMGWNADVITSDIEAIILGMHARENNPELLRATELGLKIYSYPEYLYEQSKNKKRVVIGGSHGKTSITSIILHVLGHHNMPFDYMVGAQLEGFDCMVKISDAPVMILEGDEYLSSPIDRRPKFHLYHPHVALLSGIAWDHINVFPTFENYVDQFHIFADKIEPGGSLAYFAGDPQVAAVGEAVRDDVRAQGYETPEHVIKDGVTYLVDDGEVPLAVFGDHNLQNIVGARMVCEEIGVTKEMFYEAVQTFTGASKRLELVQQKGRTRVYKDFAHSPSKLKATTAAVKKQFESMKLVACMELHTFSSLNEEFLAQYAGAMNTADTAIVYFNPHTIAHKKLKPITEEMVVKAFGREDLTVFTESDALVDALKQQTWDESNLLLMSSGNFDGVDFNELADELLS